MAITTVFSFDDEEDFQLSNVQIENETAKLGYVDNPGQIFSEDFADDTGFTYDASLAEFVGGVLRQKDQTPNNSVIGALYNSSLNANWNKDGSTSGILNGVPIIDSNKMVCTGSQGVSYAISNMYTTGAAKVKYTPNYTGSPSININILSMVSTDGTDRIVLTHSPSGDNFRITLTTGVSNHILVAETIGANSIGLIAGTEYELELNWDQSSGTIRLFRNGSLHGTLTPGSWTFDTVPAFFQIGASTEIYNRAKGSFEDAILFNTIQHSSAYVSGYTLSEYIYLENKIDGQPFIYTGLGSILSVDDATFSEIGSPRYIIGLQYWNGSAWVASDGTYAQANDYTTLIANLSAFDPSGAEDVPWSVIFPDSNSQSSIDEFSVEVTGQKYSSEGSILTNSSIYSSDINSFSSNLDEADSDIDIGFIQQVNGTNKYWDGSAWVDSDGTFSQSNTLSEVQSNIDTLISGNSEVKLKILLKTLDGTKTPTIEDATYNFNFGTVTPSDPDTCKVYGFLRDIENKPITDATVTISLKESNRQYNKASDNVIFNGSVQKTTDSEGFFYSELIRTSEFYKSDFHTGKYVITIVKDDIKIKRFMTGPILFEVPDQTEYNITKLISF